MSLHRYLPIPSDRMGIIWSLLSIKGAVVLEYGPAGTTHFSMSTFMGFGIEQENQLFTTHMSEDDVIMGDVSRLEKSIIEIDKNYAPKAIFIVASSVSSVVGTDLKAICNYMQDEVNAKLYALENGGFRGDYTVGIRDVYLMLAKEAVKPSEGIQEKTFNILGASAESYRIRSDLWQINYMMERAFGYKMLTSFSVGGDLENIARAGEAEINLVLRNEALPCAKHLNKKHDTPYFYGSPYGYQGSAEWLKEAGNILGIEPDKEYIKEILKKSTEVSQMKVFRKMSLKKDTPSAFIVGSYDAVWGLARAFEEIGIENIVKICTHSMKLIENKDSEILHCEKEKDLLDLIKKADNALVFADDISLKLCKENCTTVLFSSPWIFHPQIAEHMPFMGERGMDYILEQAQAYFRKLN